MSVRTAALLSIAALALSAGVTRAASNDPGERGRELAERNCATCHSIGVSGQSPNPQAPAFRSLYKRYPVDALGPAFASGLKVGHGDMPEFIFEQQRINDILAYLRSLDPCGKPSSDAAAMARCFEPL